MQLVEEILKGNIRALSKAISLVENRHHQSEDILSEIFPHTGKGYLIGVTGAPGSGKSSLVDRMIAYYRQEGKSVGVIAVDPSSPFSGGALLGDRIRMQEHSIDPGVFIRSMGSRGSLGGLSQAARDTARLMDAFGKDIIILETVGVGQSEVEVMNVAHTVLVVLTPNSGDTIQILKAGIMEIADLFVINKSDLDGAHKVKNEVEAYLKLKAAQGWQVPVFPVMSLTGEGVSALCEGIYLHRDYLYTKGVWEKKLGGRLRNEVVQITMEKVMSYVTSCLNDDDWKDLLSKMDRHQVSPYQVADKVAKILLGIS